MEKEEKNITKPKSETKTEVSPVIEKKREAENERQQLVELLASADKDRVAALTNFAGGMDGIPTTPLRSRLHGFLMTLKGYKAGSSRPSEIVDSAFGKLLDLAVELLRGEVSISTLEFAMKGLTYDADVAKAANEASEKAKAEMTKSQPHTDGIPHLSGSGPIPETGNQFVRDNIFSLADGAR